MVWGNDVVPAKTLIRIQLTVSAQEPEEAGEVSQARDKSRMTDQCNGYCELEPDISAQPEVILCLCRKKCLYGDFGYRQDEENSCNLQKLT
jgi:hypothetical protein